MDKKRWYLRGILLVLIVILSLELFSFYVQISGEECRRNSINTSQDFADNPALSSLMEKEKYSEAELAKLGQKLFKNLQVPQVYLESDEEVREQYYYDLKSVIIKNDRELLSSAKGKIKARGNTSYDAGIEYGPIPYKLKLEDAVNFLEMGASKKWVLVPTFLDRSYLRQIIGFNTGQLIMSDSQFVPEGKMVEVYANGDYKGVYLLAESIEEDESRLEIKAKISPETTDFPFLVELEMSSPQKGLPEKKKEFCDDLDRGKDWFFVSQKVKAKEGHCEQISFDLKYPESFSEITEAQGDYIVESIEQLYKKARIGVSIADLGIDVQSFVDYFVFQEIFANDGFAHSSTYMYKNNGGLIMMGPIWDFDMYMTKVESTGFNNPELYDNVLFRYLMQDKDFEERIKKRFLEVKYKIMPIVRQGLEDLRGNAVLRVAIARDQARYPSWGRKFENLRAYQNDNIIYLGSFDAHIDYILSWMWDGLDTHRWWSDQTTVHYAGRLDWLEQNLELWAKQ